MNNKRKFYLLGLILLNIFLSGCFSRPNQNNNIKHDTKSKLTTKTPKKQKQNKLNLITYKNHIGSTISINKILNSQVENDKINIIIIEGVFTNKKNQEISLESWIVSNLKISQKFDKNEHELGSPFYYVHERILDAPTDTLHEPDTDWHKLFKKSKKKIKPNDKIQFALEYDLNKDDRFSNKLVFEPINPVTKNNIKNKIIIPTSENISILYPIEDD